MPKPVYIIAAHGLAEDKTTNLVTIFAVIERATITLRRNVEQKAGVPPVTPIEYGVMTTLAVWKKEPGDTGLYEHEFLIKFEGQEKPAGVVEFEFEPEMELKRFSLIMQGFPAPTKSCDVYIVSRIRKKGDSDWLSQQYPITFVVIPPPEGEASERKPEASRQAKSF